MAIVTNKPGMSDENTKRYYELNQKIVEKRQELEQVANEEKEKRRKLEDEINQLLLEQVLLTQNFSF